MINKENLGCIRIENLVVYANHGVLSEEKNLGQKFVISANIYADLEEAGSSDNVEKTINYAKVCELITKVSKEETFDLIETLAYALADRVLEQYELIDIIEVTVNKPFAPINLPVDNVSVTVSRKRHRAYLSLGSNMGDKKDFLDKAIKMLRKDSKIKVTNVASFIETEPYGYVEQDKFLNTALEITTLYTSKQLLKVVNEIEASLDRVRTIKWGPRTIDIDIIFYDDMIINTKDLIVPHKEMHLREFVLKPLMELKPDYRHPLIGKNIYQLYEDLQEHVQKFY